MTDEVQRPISEIDDTISKTFDIIEDNIKNDKYKTMNYDFFKTLFEIIIDCIQLIEEYNNGKSGYIKKQIVIELGEKIIQTYFPSNEEYYKENIDSIVEMIIHSYKTLASLKSVKKICIPFCC